MSKKLVEFRFSHGPCTEIPLARPVRDSVRIGNTVETRDSRAAGPTFNNYIYPRQIRFLRLSIDMMLALLNSIVYQLVAVDGIDRNRKEG